MNVYEYKGYWICRIGENPGIWRVKSEPDASFALHHGNFAIATEAENWVDRNCPRKDKTDAPPQYREPTIEDAMEIYGIDNFDEADSDIACAELLDMLKQLNFYRKVQS